MSFLKQMIFSIARTFGRIIAYAIIGALIALMAGKVFAAPQYRVSTGSWGEWTNANVDTDYSFATSVGTSWSSFIQLKDTVAFENNKTYNLNANLEVVLRETGTREMNSALDPYIYNGSTLTNVSDKCTITGTRTDKTSTVSSITYTTHTYKVNVNCVGLKNEGYYPYLTLRFLTDTSHATTFNFNVKSWEYHVGTDSTDANNIMNNANQNTQQIIENYNQNTQEIIQSNQDLANSLAETIENQNKVCTDRTYSFTMADVNNLTSGFLNDLGNIVVSSTTWISDYISIEANNTYNLSTNIGNLGNSSSYCLYDKNYNKLSCQRYNNVANLNITPTQKGYIRLSLYLNNNNSVIILYNGKFCYNAVEKEVEESEEQTNLLTQIGQGILHLPSEIGNVFQDLLIYLFVPDDFDFSDEILEPLEEKLGFIAEIPIEIITWLINLPNVNYDEFTGFTFPSFSFKDYTFWESQEVDITQIRNTLAPYKIYTSLTCVVICINTLYRHYHNFANGD